MEKNKCQVTHEAMLFRMLVDGRDPHTPKKIQVSTRRRRVAKKPVVGETCKTTVEK